MRKKLKWDEKIGILFFIVSLGMLGISIYLCFSSDIWYDELFTMGFVRNSAGELISLTASDVHPPLYYLIVHLFVIPAGENYEAQVFMAKAASVFPFLLGTLLSATKVRKYFGMFTAGLFSFLVISMPQLAAYTVEIRMYGYALLFITTGMLYAYELVRKNTEEEPAKRKAIGWIGLTICALCACYTHYFACVAACMIYLYLGICFGIQVRKKEKSGSIFLKWLISGMICVVGYLPWLYKVVTAQVGKVQDNYWIQPVSFRTLGGCVKFIFKPSFTDERVNIVLAILFFAIYGLLVLRLIISWWKKQDNQPSFVLGCLGVLFGVILFGMAASILMKPVFVYRYMLPALGGFWLAFAILLNGLKEKKALLGIFLVIIGITGLRNYRAFYGDEIWKKLQMEQAKAVLSQIDEKDILLFNFDQGQAVISYYVDNESYLWYGEPEELIKKMYPENHALVEGEFTDEAGMEKIKALLLTGKEIWYLGSGNARDEIRKKWEENGIATEEVKSLMVERYWFNLYRVTSD